MDVSYPVPPAGLPGGPGRGGAPGELAGALRITRPAARVPQFMGDLDIDPMSLRGRLWLHGGMSTLTVDDRRMTLRIGTRRSRILWTDIWAFEQRFKAAGGQTVPRGRLVALTTLGPVELPATRGSRAEVRHVHAVLDAYRIRAQTAHSARTARGD